MLHLNEHEHALFLYIKSRRKPVTLTQAAKACFPALPPAKANSWVRNSIRRLRDEQQLVQKVDKGTYTVTKKAVGMVIFPVPVRKRTAKPKPQSTVDFGEFQALINATVRRASAKANQYRSTRFSSEDIDDLIQDVNVRLLSRQLGRFDGSRAKLSTFIHYVARSVTIDAMRTRSRRPQTVDYDGPEHVEQGMDSLERLIRSEQEDLVTEAMSQLAEDDIDFANSFLGDEFDLDAYAKAKGVSSSSVYVRKHRLTKKIASVVADITKAS